MVKCPKCNYTLVLLEHRQKYKCAKCGRLFPQQEIDAREFREKNKLERQKDRKQWLKEARANTNAKKAISKIIGEINNPKHRKTKEEYYEKNRETIINQKRSYRLSLSDQQKKEQNEKRKARRYKNVEATRLQGRINYWKQRQRALAVQFVENEGYKAHNSSLGELVANISAKPVKRGRV